MILTDKFEIAIIEIPKYRKGYKKNEKLDTWLKFIDNPEEMNMEDIHNDESIEQAQELLEKISQDEYERELEWKRELFQMDLKAYKATALEKGMKEGLEKGIEKGIEKEKIRIAKSLLEKNIDLQVISECTGLSIAEIENLK